MRIPNSHTSTPSRLHAAPAASLLSARRSRSPRTRRVTSPLALREFRTYRRISGSNDQLPLMVDSERGVGRPDRALEVGRAVDRAELPVAVQVSLAIAMSGPCIWANPNWALAELEIPQLDPDRAFSYSPALFSAYSEVLEELGGDGWKPQTWRARTRFAQKPHSVVRPSPRSSRSSRSRRRVSPRLPSHRASSPDRKPPVTTPVSEAEPEYEVEVQPDAGRSITDADTRRPTRAPCSRTTSPRSIAEGVALNGGSESETRTRGARWLLFLRPPSRRRRSRRRRLVRRPRCGVYAGPHAIPHAVESLNRVKAPPVGYITNNASRTDASVAAHLTELGSTVTAHEVVTRPQAAVRLLADQVARVAVLVVGGEGLV